MMTGFLGTLKPGSQQWSCPACLPVYVLHWWDHICVHVLPLPHTSDQGLDLDTALESYKEQVKGGGGNPPHQPISSQTTLDLPAQSHPQPSGP